MTGDSVDLRRSTKSGSHRFEWYLATILLADDTQDLNFAQNGDRKVAAGPLMLTSHTAKRDQR